MILVSSATGSAELAPLIRTIGVPVQLTHMAFGDFAFDGHGPNGPITVGIERKTLHDMLHCIDDSRYAGYQKGGMQIMYGISVLALEGLFKPHEPEGTLMEGFKGGASWGPCRYLSRTNLYSKLYRHLLSISLSGVIVTQSRDRYQTAFNVCEWWNYFQKPWDHHRSLLEVQSLPLATVTGRSSLVKRWASQIDGIGVKISQNVEDVFKTPFDMALGNAEDWASVRGLSLQTAHRIVKEIRGEK